MGILRADGQAVFIPGALDGEEVRAVLSGRRKSGAAWGELAEILSPSPHRLTPACPHYASCGGCQLLHASYAHQLEIKQAILTRALKPLLKTDADILLKLHPVIPAPEPFAYRNKGIFALGPSDQSVPSVPARSGGGVLRTVSVGFYGRRSRTIAGHGCPALFSRQVNALLDDITLWFTGARSGVVNDVHHVLIRESKTAGGIVLVLIGDDEPLWLSDFHAAFALSPSEGGAVHGDYALTGVGWLSAPAKDGPVVGGRPKTLWGSLDAVEQLEPDGGNAGDAAPLRFVVSPEAFFQINTHQAEVLYNEAVRLCAPAGGEVFWDLYCGSGTISLFLARRAQAVLGVDVSEASIRDAWRNARANADIRPTALPPGSSAGMGAANGSVSENTCGVNNGTTDENACGNIGEKAGNSAVGPPLDRRVCFLAGAAEEILSALLPRPDYLADILARQRKLRTDADGQSFQLSPALSRLLSNKKPDVIVLDPPAKGVGFSVIEAILSVRPDKILYISCDPATLARDLSRLTGDRSYRVDQIQPVDMFPQTAHVETIALLTKQ